MATAVVKPGACELYQSPTSEFFEEAQRAEMEERLQQRNDVTLIKALMEPEELKIDESGATMLDGYRFTSTSFQQLSCILAAGASTLLRDISGGRPDQDGRHLLSNSQLARSLFNDLVDLRFALLDTYRVIRNIETRMIDGVIGPKHFVLENSALYNHVHNAVGVSAGQTAVFHSGLLIGRKMLLWYRSRRPFMVRSVGDGDGDVWNFYAGYFFCNGEDRGTSARGTLALFCKRGICLGPYHKFGDRVAHIGKDFHRRLDRMLGKIFSAELPVPQLQAGLVGLLEAPLRCERLTKREFAARIKLLTRAVVAIGVPQRIAGQIVDDALHIGHQTSRPETSAPLAYSRDRIFAGRTAFDIFAGLLASAGRMNLGRREVLEQAAWQMLAGDFSVD